MNFRMVHFSDTHMSYLGGILGEFLLKMCKEEEETTDSIPETRHGQGLLVAYTRTLTKGSLDEEDTRNLFIFPTWMTSVMVLNTWLATPMAVKKFA